MTGEEIKKLAEWLRERPPSVRVACLAFPPGCIVRANRPLLSPPPGEEGSVISYVEYPDGRAGVRVANAINNVAGACDLEWVTVVGYQGVTPEDVRRALALLDEKPA